MKKNNQDLMILISLTLILFFLLTHYNLIIENISSVTKLWLFKLFPSLFPFLVIGSILINYNFSYYLNQLFKIKRKDLVILILAMLSGFPASAKYTKDMYQKNLISKKTANNVLCYSFFANPLFLLSTLSLAFQKKITILIILSHYLANFFILLFFKNEEPIDKMVKENMNLGNVIAKSIKDSINTLLLILGTITFYNIFITFLKDIFHNKILITFLTGFLEFSQGLNALPSLSLSIYLKALMALFFISFGSLSILTQIKSIIADTNLNFKKFVLFRFVHVIIASFLFTFFYFL